MGSKPPSQLPPDLPPLPQELTIAEAAEVLGVSTKTIRAYLAEGSLVARDAAPLSSIRKMWRIPLEAAMALRGSYASQAQRKDRTDFKESSAALGAEVD